MVSRKFFQLQPKADVNVDVLSQEISEKVADRVAGREIDFAIAWVGYEWEFGAGKVKIELVPASETPIFVLVHPAHEIAQKASLGKPLAVRTIGRYPIVHPHLRQLQTLVRHHFNESAYQVGGVPAVINQVRTTRALGLIPGWKWLTNEIGQIYGLMAAPLDLEEQMQLQLILPHGGRRSVSQYGRDFLDVFDRTLHLLVLADEWQTTTPTPGRLARDLRCSKDLFIYHISKGPTGGVPRPQWVQGRLESLEVNGTNVAAKVDWGQIGRPQLDGRIVSRAPEHTDFLLMTAIDDQQCPLRAGSLCLSIPVTRPNLPKSSFCIAGIFAYEGNDGRPTASLVVVSSCKLAMENLESLERSHLISLLGRGDADSLAANT